MFNVVGMDSSGELMYIGIIIGDIVSIRKIWKLICLNVNVNEIHMSKLSLSLNKKILRLFSNYSYSLKLICVRLNYPLIRHCARILFRRTPKDLLLGIISKLIRESILEIINKYCQKKYILSVNGEITKTLGLKSTYEIKEAIELADVVAWYNLRSSRRGDLRGLLKDVIYINLERDLQRKIERVRI